MRNCKVSSSWNVFTWKLSIRRCLQGFWRAYSSIVSCRRIWDGRSFLVDQTHLFWSIIIHSTAGVHSIAQDITGIFYRSTFGLIWVSTFKQARSKAPEVRISTTRCQMHGRPTLKRITLLTIFQNLSPIYIPPTQWLTFPVCMCSAVLTSISHAHWCGKRENCGCLRMGGLVPPERSTIHWRIPIHEYGDVYPYHIHSIYSFWPLSWFDHSTVRNRVTRATCANGVYSYSC